MKTPTHHSTACFCKNFIITVSQLYFTGIMYPKDRMQIKKDKKELISAYMNHYTVFGVVDGKANFCANVEAKSLSIP